MLNFKSNITYYLSSAPTDMRKGREGLCGVVREVLERSPHNYNEAFIFYSKDLRKVKILHYDINGFVIYEKWFDDGRFLSPYFKEGARSHQKEEKSGKSCKYKRKFVNLPPKTLESEEL